MQQLIQEEARLLPERFYHLFNRGNNRQPIFFQKRNYIFFLRKIKTHLAPCADILAYCLMPNHFHILLYTKSEFENTSFSKGLRTMLSSFTRAINHQEQRSGSLFQQNSKTKDIENYPLICMNYIHQNPLKARLVGKMEEWEFSSIHEYLEEKVAVKLCNRHRAYELIGIPMDSQEFLKQSYSLLDDNLIRKIME